MPGRPTAASRGAAVAGLLLAVAPARAAAVDIEHLRAAGGVRDFVVTTSPAVADDLEVGGGLLLSWAHQPLIAGVRTDGRVERTRVLVDDRVDGEAYASMGLLGRLEMTVGLPVTLRQAGESPDGGSLAPAGLGDVRLGLKAVLVDPAGAGFGAALSPRASFPSGDPEALRGDGFVTASTAATLGHEGRRHRAAVEGGVTFRRGGDLGDLRVGRQLFLRAALGWLATPRAELLGEVAGVAGSDFGADADGAPGATPVEALASARIALTGDVRLTLGGGTGVVAGYGAPRYRLFAGAAWAPGDRDRDGDGVPDRRDDCPREPEDADGFADADGCPDPDNDGDGVSDVDDRCDGEAEDVDGHRDGDGCPDPDNDGDGILDARDDCPGEREDIDGFADGDGCPDPDNDGDGVPDDRDDCPANAEDLDGHADGDGCPDPDNDGDGLPDPGDRCPGEAEDPDGHADDDGCPDPDNDGDGIADGADLCPDAAEDADGVADRDGCPDEPGGSRLVAIRDNRIIPLKPVEFERDDGGLTPASGLIVDEVARVLREHPGLAPVRIEAHLDDQGDRDERRRRSQGQALEVMRRLVAQGVDPGRLVAQGFGADRPVDARGTPEGRSANRRIEIHVGRR